MVTQDVMMKDCSYMLYIQLLYNSVTSIQQSYKYTTVLQVVEAAQIQVLHTHSRCRCLA